MWIRTGNEVRTRCISEMFTAVTCSARLQVYLLLAGLHKCDCRLCDGDIGYRPGYIPAKLDQSGVRKRLTLRTFRVGILDPTAPLKRSTVCSSTRSRAPTTILIGSKYIRPWRLPHPGGHGKFCTTHAGMYAAAPDTSTFASDFTVDIVATDKRGLKRFDNAFYCCELAPTVR